MGNGNAPELVTAITSFMAFVLPLVFIPFAFKFSSTGLHKLYGSIQNGVQRAGNRASNLATKAAKNSTVGMQAQQLWNERKASRVRTAQDRNQQLIGGSSGWSAALRRGIAGNDPARQQAFAEQMRNAYQDRTQKSMSGKNPIAIGDLARLNRGQSVDDYIASRADIQADLNGTNGASRQANAQQRMAALREMHQQFGNQIGSDEFREAALHAAVNAGSNTDDVMAGMRNYVAQYRGSDANLAQSMGRVAQSAKASGFAEYSAVGFQGTQAAGNRAFNQFQIKPATSVMRNMDLSKQEAGQFIVANAASAAAHSTPTSQLAVGDRTDMGNAIYDRLVSSDLAERNAMLRDISRASRSKPFQDEYVRIVRDANAYIQSRPVAPGATPPPDLEAELNTMISRV